MLLAAGCNLLGPNHHFDAELSHYKEVARTVEQPELNTPPSEHAYSPPPRTIDHNAAPASPHEWWDLSLDEAIQLAVARSSVLRDLGGTVVRSPDSLRTILQPAQVASDARFGMEAALAEFDATVSSSVIAEKNDRMVNNFVAAGGTRIFQQDLINFQSQISKRGVAGTQMTLRGTSNYDFNNASFNRFPSVWDTLVEAEIRQPLWQGAGARFNRLAGPNSLPGFYNGVLIARVNTDISVADFEMGLRDLVSNVENAYWDLYFAYRDLDARIQLRNAALDAWKRIKVLVESDQAGGQIEREVQAREQYFRYEEDVQNALAGTLQQSTTNNNGSSGGSFRGLGGVLVSERRLRLAIGLPITDGRMIRPADEPTLAKVYFDWAAATDDAIARRPELLKQRLVIKRREMEYVAARNFLLPRFDVLGRYRYRGLGKDLIGDQVLPPDPGDPSGAFARSSLANLVSGDFQEWQLGGEVLLPIGFRRGWAAVRNAQLNLAREKAVLEEQERQVIHDLSNALGDMQRAYQLMETAYNRRLAAQQNVDILRFRLQSSQPVTAEQLLEAERRMADADIQYHRALVEHMLALKNIHFEKGTLLEYGHIQLAEQISMSQVLPARSSPPGDQPLVVPQPLPEPTPAKPLFDPGVGGPSSEFGEPSSGFERDARTPPSPAVPIPPPSPAVPIPPPSPGAPTPQPPLPEALPPAPQPGPGQLQPPLPPVISLSRPAADASSLGASPATGAPRSDGSQPNMNPLGTPLPARALPPEVTRGDVMPVSYMEILPPTANPLTVPSTRSAGSPTAGPQNILPPPPPSPLPVQPPASAGPLRPGSVQVTEIPLGAGHSPASERVERAWFAQGAPPQGPVIQTIVPGDPPSGGVQQAFWQAGGPAATQVWTAPADAPPPPAAQRLPLPDAAQRLPQPDGMLRLPAPW